jgi:hypothetical protein
VRKVTNGGIDIARRADRRIDQHAGGGEDLDRLLVEQPSRHVEIVDHHVAEQAARDAHIGERRRARVAARDAEQLDPADPSVAQLAFEPRKVGIEAPVEAYHQRHAAFGDDRKTRLGAAPVEVERLLAKDGLAGAGRRLDEVGMGVGRAGDDDGLDRTIGKDRGLRPDLATVAARQLLGRGGIDVDDRAETGPGMASDVLRVDGPDATGAELTQADHGRVFGYCPILTIMH